MTEQNLNGGEFPAEGYSSFEVSSTRGDKAGQKLVSVTTRLTYEFGRTVDSVDLVAPHAEAQNLADELAEARLSELMNKERATTGVAPSPQAPVGIPAPQAGVPSAGTVAPPSAVPAPPPYPAAALGIPAAPQAPAPTASGWAVGNKPQGKGQIKYLTTQVLDTQRFRDLIADGIDAHGFNPDDFVIYDNRVGDRGLEAGQENWSVANVRAADTGPYAAALAKKSAFFVDFNDDGTIRIKPTRDMETAQRLLSNLQPTSPV